MTHRIGGVEVQGCQPGNVIFCAFNRKNTDGGRSRIRRKREVLGLNTTPQCDLTQMHADPELLCDVAYGPDADKWRTYSD